MKSLFNAMFGTKRKFRIIFKSGQHVDFACDNLTIHKSGNDLVTLDVTGLSKPDALFYIRLDDISAIVSR